MKYNGLLTVSLFGMLELGGFRWFQMTKLNSCY